MSSPIEPTLRIGQRGQLSGHEFTVAGLMVMSMVDEGVTYYWNEYQLGSPDGTSATLVEEEGGRGREWRIFRDLEPPPLLSAAEAGAKRVGDPVDLAGERLRVSCVAQSRVVRIEGQVPEGVEEGDIARYFNAESGNQMFVVSWTGDELEGYRGVQLPAHAVHRAFGLPPPVVQMRPAETLNRSGGGMGSDGGGGPGMVRNLLVAVVFGLFVLGVMNGRRVGCRPTSSRAAGSATPVAPVAKLAVGGAGVIGGARYEVTGRAELEINRTDGRYVRQEYRMQGADDEVLWLVQGTESSASDWQWLRPVVLASPLRPVDAATNRLGDRLTISNQTVRVTDFLMTRVQAVAGTNLGPAGAQRYGLEARAGADRYLVRWSESELAAFRVVPLAKEEKEAINAFSQPGAR